jgi:hypothetical protein
VAISKDRHARIIIMRREITLHSEAGYIFADCSRLLILLAVRRRTIHVTPIIAQPSAVLQSTRSGSVFTPCLSAR